MVSKQSDSSLTLIIQEEEKKKLEEYMKEKERLKKAKVKHRRYEISIKMP